MANESMVTTTTSSSNSIISTNNTILSTDIYDAVAFIEALKAKHLDIPEETLAMGVFGYLNEVHSNILENIAIMSAEYANEAVPTRAQFERNVISHALSLGIEKIKATPATMEVYMALPIDILIDNMTDNKIVIDKDMDIYITNSINGTKYVYRLDYDMQIHRTKVPSGKWVYSAEYLIDDENEISDITNPYLPQIGTATVSNGEFILIKTKLRQTVRNTIYKKIISNNPLETKSLTFSFENQLAYFYVKVVEQGKTHLLKCLYDGLYAATDEEEYCNYLYIDESTIRITFNRDSYQPTSNADVTVYVYTTSGSSANFDYNETAYMDMSSSRYAYDKLYTLIIPITSSQYGLDKKSVADLKQMIPKQMLSRNSITTYTDLNNYFNQLNSDENRIYFKQKIHNQLERIFFGYILMKDDLGNVIPTNTVDVSFGKDLFTNKTTNNFILPTGSVFYCNGTTTTGIPSKSLTDEKILEYDQNGFLYITPFLTVINKNPLMANYYCNILDYDKTVNFDYINQDSPLQFICEETVNVLRPFYPVEDRNTYTTTITVQQNISNDFNIIGTDELGNIIKQNIDLYGIVYRNGSPYKYTKAKLINYDEEKFSYTFEFTFTSNDTINTNGDILINTGLKNLNETDDVATYLSNNVGFKFFIVAKLDDVDYGLNGLGQYIPNLDGYTLCNTYELYSGLDLYYNYTDVMESYINLSMNKSTNELDYTMTRVPLVRYRYLDTQEKASSFISILDTRKRYLETTLALLEDSFGIDFKFFNTYGPSKYYLLSYANDTVLLDKINLTLKFEVKFKSSYDSYALNDITAYIRTYIEDINYISDLHIPNLITAVTNKFNDQLTYFKFVGLNDYGYIYQSIEKNPEIDITFDDSTMVPEFLNIDTIDGDPSIAYTVYDDSSTILT